MSYTYTLKDIMEQGISISKQEIESMSKEEFYDLKQECYDSDYYEFLDHFQGQRSIETAWKEFEMETEAFVTPEMMFDNDMYKFNSASEYQEHLAEIENQKQYEKYLQDYFEYHHIEKEKTPYYQVCVNKIDKALIKT